MKEEKFSIFIPLEIEKGNDGEDRYANMKFKGIASNPNEGYDKQGQWLDPRGFDLNDFIKSGTFNWHHRWKDKPTAIVGEPTRAEVTKSGELYVEGTLYKSSQVARDIYDLAEVLQADSPNRRIGMSIEGIPTMVDPKNKNRILKARLTNIALTPAPICPGTSMELIKGGLEDLQFEQKEDFLIDITDENGTRWTVDKNLQLEKAEVSGELEKGGEGSKGGKVIGHTKSGKPIYDTASHEGHKDFSGQDHREARAVHEKKAMKHYDTMHTAGVPVNKRRASGQKYTNHMNQANSHMESAYSKDNGISKAMEAGSITGTETHNQSLTQQSLKQESITGTEGKKKKRDYKKLLANLRKRRGEDSDGVIRDLSKGEVIEALVEEGLDQESAERVFELSDAIEKAEGSRGGKVIGHTKSGKPIYQSSHFESNHKGFSKEDHADAHKVHRELAGKAQGEGRFGDVEHHKQAAKTHKVNAESKVGEKKKFTPSSDKIWKPKFGTGVGPISKAQAFTTLLSDHNLDIESAKNVYALAEAIEKAEGSRGGKIIGHTKSGKPIYNHRDVAVSYNIHPDYKDFTHEDHSDASKLHEKLTTEALTSDPDFTWHGESEKNKETLEKYWHHQNASAHHARLSNPKDSMSRDVPFKKAEEREIEKGGEGTRGGHVIGHTKSGKPVYENKQAHTYKGFSKQDHKDAHEAHNKEAKRLHPYTLGKSGHDNKANKAHEKLDHHSTTADDHLAEYDTLSEKEHEERTKGGEGKMFSKDQLKKFGRSVDKSRGISKAEIFTTLLSDFNLDTESARNVYALAEAIEKAEGSRGGKVIGHTKSGKPIYEHHGHESHAFFSSQDHRDAVDVHDKIKNHSNNSGKDKLGDRVFHRDQINWHSRQAERMKL